MIVCLKCNRQMLKKETVQFETRDSYQYFAYKVSCPECQGEVALTITPAKYSPDSTSKNIISLIED